MQMEAPAGQAQSSSFLRFIFGKNPTWTVVRILFVVFVTLILFKFVLVPIRVTGDSMYPTYRNGQIKFVNKLAYMNKNPERGDVVAVEYRGREILLLKRVIALPGETLQVIEGEFYINGNKLSEPYARGKIPASATNLLGYTDPIPMGKSEYFIMGDNRPVSEGYTEDRSKILGKIL